MVVMSRCAGEGRGRLDSSQGERLQHTEHDSMLAGICTGAGGIQDHCAHPASKPARSAPPQYHQAARRTCGSPGLTGQTTPTHPVTPPVDWPGPAPRAPLPDHPPPPLLLLSACHHVLLPLWQGKMTWRGRLALVQHQQQLQHHHYEPQLPLLPRLLLLRLWWLWWLRHQTEQTALRAVPPPPRRPRRRSNQRSNPLPRRSMFDQGRRGPPRLLPGRLR